MAMTHDRRAAEAVELSPLATIRFMEAALDQLANDTVDIGVAIARLEASSDEIDLNELDQLGMLVAKKARTAERLFIETKSLLPKIDSTYPPKA